MQIHELNTFEGYPGDTDYLAVDQGFDTAKISASKLMEPVRNEIEGVNNNYKYKVNTPLDSEDQPSAGIAGQLLRTNGDGSTEWTDAGLPSDEQTAAAVSEWLDNHPEATTTVLDDSISKRKLDDALMSEIYEASQAISMDDYFGINIHPIDNFSGNFDDPGHETFSQALLDSELDALSDTGFSVVRTTSATWFRIEVSQGVYDFTYADKVINSLIADGYRPLIMLGNSIPMSFYDNCVYPTTESQLTAFANYAGAVAQHYANHNVIYQIWNEPQYTWHEGSLIETDYETKIQTYGEAVLRCAAAIRANDPTGKVASGSFGYTANLRYNYITDTVLKNVDYLSAHLYQAGYSEETLLSKISQINAYVYSVYGKSVPLIVTETGYSTVPNYTGPRTDLAIATESDRAKYLIRSMLAQLAYGVEICVVHDAWNDQSDPGDPEDWFGIYTTAFGATTTSDSIKTAIAELKDYKYIGRALTADCDFILVFSNKDSIKIAYWTCDSSHVLVMPGGSITLTNAIAYKEIPIVPELFAQSLLEIPYIFNPWINSIKFGADTNKATGYRSAVFGQDNIAGDFNNLVTGQENETAATNSLASGRKNTITGAQGFATGYNNTVSGNNAIAEGAANTAEGTYSHVAGSNNHAKGDNQFVVGEYAKDAADEYFSVGAGISNNARKTAFAVKKDSTYQFGDTNLSESDLSSTKNKLKTTFTDISGYASADNKFTAPSNGNIYLRALSGGSIAVAVGSAGYAMICSENNAFMFPIHTGETVYVVTSSGTTYARFIAYQ